jgi:KRAB domain-containing zinc finger protein
MSSGLQAHLIYSGEKSYSCSQCSKSFTTSSGLQVHLRTHSGRNLTAAPDVKSPFIHLSGLQVHLRTHFGEKLYICSQCSKLFTTSSGLQVHLRTYSGEKYSWSLRSKSFTMSYRLQVHLRIKSGRNLTAGHCVQRRLLHHRVASTFENSFWGETVQLLPMLKIFCPFIWVASTFKNSFWGETLQLLTVFKVAYYVILVAGTFKNSFWGGTLQLLTMFKVVYYVIWVASTFKNSFWKKPYSCSQCSQLFTMSSGLQVHLRIYSGRNRTGCSCLTYTKSFSVSDKLNHHINQCCGSRIRIFSIPDPGSEFFLSRSLDPGFTSKNLSILTPKNCF